MVRKYRILSVIGTRPEAIKMAPVIHQLSNDDRFESAVCVTGQHRSMLDQVLAIFEIDPDFDLDIMKTDQTLNSITSEIMLRMKPVLQNYLPDMVLVHGDTTTTFVTSLCSFYEQISVGHVEAGLRTGDMYSPWPEEMNRALTGKLASIHFAPTERAKNNLILEGVNVNSIHLTGNTVIDALNNIVGRLNDNSINLEAIEAKTTFIKNHKKTILVTGHRRESIGLGFEGICDGLSRVAADFPEVAIVYPVHLNPKVYEPVHAILGERKNIYLIEPVDYVSFVYLMSKADIILTDSGGVQEEAPSLGKPVLVMRDNSERPEAIECGAAKLVGTDPDIIYDEIKKLLINEGAYSQMSNIDNPYGDGAAAKKIIDRLFSFCSEGDKNV